MKTTLSHRSISACLLAGLAASALLPGCSGTPTLVEPQIAAQDMDSAPLAQYSVERVAAVQLPLHAMALK